MNWAFIVFVFVVVVISQAAVFPIVPEQHEIILSTPGAPQQQIYFTRVS